MCFPNSGRTFEATNAYVAFIPSQNVAASANGTCQGSLGLSTSDWWFGTCVFSISYMGCHPSHRLIFFKMVKTTNQLVFMKTCFIHVYGYLHLDHLQMDLERACSIYRFVHIDTSDVWWRWNLPIASIPRPPFCSHQNLVFDPKISLGLPILMATNGWSSNSRATRKPSMQLVLFNKKANGWVTEKLEKHPNSDLVWLVVSNMNG